ncbi:MAG: PH domain-containing protein [Bacilli bacterium]|nr:PH domain-containing protein [Bacilli bacterium]
MGIDEEYFKIDNKKSNDKIEDILEEDERILVRLRPNKKAYILERITKMLPIALIWLLFDGGFIAIMIATGAFIESPEMIWFIVPFFLFHLAPVWIWIASIVKGVGEYKNIEYAFTEKRVIIRSGMIGIDFKTFYYSDIVGVNVKVGILEKMFRVGDIYLKSATQAAILDDIPNPYEYLSKLQKITLDIKADIYYPNDLRPEENHGYNTKYKG